MNPYMTNQHKIEAYKKDLIERVGKFMVRFKYELIEFTPTFRIYTEHVTDKDYVLIPCEVLYMHDDGTLGLKDREDVDISELSIHEIAFILDYLELNNYKPLNIFNR